MRSVSQFKPRFAVLLYSRLALAALLLRIPRSFGKKILGKFIQEVLESAKLRGTIH